MRFEKPQRASCDCGTVQVEIDSALTHFYCHCSVCQRAGNTAFGTPIVLWRKDLKIQNPDMLSWSRFRWTPINVRRGACQKCGTLMVEHLSASPFSIVLAKTFADAEALPDPSGHAFYETRVDDVSDSLPKLEGYLRSQLAISKWILAGILDQSDGSAS